MRDSLASSEAKTALIQKHEVGLNRPKQIADYELQRFGIRDVQRILDCLHTLERATGSRDICGPPFNHVQNIPIWMSATLLAMKTLGVVALFPVQVGAALVLILRGYFKPIWTELPRPTFDVINWCRDEMSYVKAPIHLVNKSIEQGAALCVNRHGKFRVRTEGYAVMSHVWAETMGWQRMDGWGPVELSLREMGLSMAHFLRFFDRCQEEWLWVDVIALPEVLEVMSIAQKMETEKLRIGVINSLHFIYTRADKIVVIDTTLLRLSTRSLVDVAAVLCLSFWVTRLWTFTEARLAKKVVVKTRDWSFDLDEILEYLIREAVNNEHRYYNIFRRLLHLREESVHGIPPHTLLQSAYWAGEHRHTDVDVDQARILFPLLDLKWHSGWTLHQGLLTISDAYPADAEWLNKWCHYRRINFNVS